MGPLGVLLAVLVLLLQSSLSASFRQTSLVASRRRIAVGSPLYAGLGRQSVQHASPAFSRTGLSPATNAAFGSQAPFKLGALPTKKELWMGRAKAFMKELVRKPLLFMTTLYVVLLIAKGVISLSKMVGPASSGGQSVAESKSAGSSEEPLQVLECERCGVQLHPARGRAERVLSNPKFHCSRCGAGASAFFDINSKTDPRALTRLERLEREAVEDYSEYEEGSGSDDSSNGQS